MKTLLTLLLATCSVTFGFAAEASDDLQIYECRYEGVDAHGYRMLEVGHVITSNVNGVFETRTLGMQRADGPSAQVYAWQLGPNAERALYLALFDNDDSSNYDGLTIRVGAPEGRVALTAAGASATLTCHVL